MNILLTKSINMKKFTFLLVAVLVWVAAASAQDAQSLLSFNWAHSIDGGTSAGDNIFDLSLIHI